MRVAPLFLVLLATAARAEAPLTGAEFEAAVAGRTLTYGAGGEAYGVERYHDGRRVTWAFVGEACQAGTWHEPEPGLICFAYEDLEPEQCWRFYDGPGGLRAEFVNDPGVSLLYQVAEDDLALVCPDYGV